MGETDPPELAETIADVTGQIARPELAATQADTSPHAEDGVGRDLARGAAIGRYIILEVLGAGGMGVVYRAYDPELDRKVALKLVRHRLGGAGDTGGRARMLREAQAIARLSHPNVVAVHDVGTAEDVVFIAMELVEGDTLAAWLRSADRTVAAIVDELVQAGRGLAAAHRSGLVHRDFKPDNVLVGHDGRTRVVDFGLVRGLDGNATADAIVEPNVRASEPMLSTPLTVLGTVMGTPLYMAPEQLLNGKSDARTDQYSFSVTLYEALSGELPYVASDLNELKAKVAAGKAPALPAARKVPAHVAAAIRRGMSVDPAARWPAMDDLLAELARDPAARRRRWLAGGAAVVSIAGLAITIPLLARGGGEASPCGGASEQLAAAWGPPRRTALHAAFAATHQPYAEAAFDGVARQLDRYGAAWVKSYEDSCQATHVRGEQSVELLDLRTGCLSRRRTELATLVELLVAAGGKSIAHAHTVVAGLSPVADCDDLAALQSPAKLPADAAARKAIAEIRDALARAEALFYTGHYKDALPQVEALATRARALGYRPLEAEVDLLLAELHIRTQDAAGGPALLVAAFVAATAGGHDDIAQRSATSLAIMAAYKPDFERGHDWLALAEALVERMGKPPRRSAAVQFASSYLLSAEGKHGAAVEQLEKALAIRERLGTNSEEVGHTLSSLANEYDELGRYADARAAGERALALEVAELGPLHPDNAITLTNLGNIASDEGDPDRATAYYKRALAIREQTPDDEPALIANVYNNLGAIAQEAGRSDDAVAYHRRALAIREKLDADGPDVAMSLSNIGAAQLKKGEIAMALATYQRSLDIAERKLGKEHPFVGDALAGIGEAAFLLHHFDESQAALERALAIRKLGARPNELADVKLQLARTVWERGDHARALALAAEARAGFATPPPNKQGLGETDAWLHAHGK